MATSSLSRNAQYEWINVSPTDVMCPCVDGPKPAPYIQCTQCKKFQHKVCMRDFDFRALQYGTQEYTAQQFVAAHYRCYKCNPQQHQHLSTNVAGAITEHKEAIRDLMAPFAASMFCSLSKVDRVPEGFEVMWVYRLEKLVLNGLKAVELVELRGRMESSEGEDILWCLEAPLRAAGWTEGGMKLKAGVLGEILGVANDAAVE